MDQRNFYNLMHKKEYEVDSCGIGFIAHLKGDKSNYVVKSGLEILKNMSHRGADSADGKSGDGAGIMIQLPHELYSSRILNLPELGKYGTGIVFMPKNNEDRRICEKIIEDIIREENLKLIAFSDVEVDSSILGEISGKTEPYIKQIFIGSDLEQAFLERKLYLLRKKIENRIRNSNIASKESFYICSLSTKVIVYKGMLQAEQLDEYYKDLKNPLMKSAIALVHSRFSTNTFPTWDLAQPFRMIAHNGEINTIKGNRIWMSARESVMEVDFFGDNLKEIYPIIEPDKSDSASLDNVLEFLIMAGKTIPQAISILIPESWNDKNPIPESLKNYYEYYATIMEPWDGPASIVFTDGRYVGGTLDRNGLRPSRYIITEDDYIIMASEVGTLNIPPQNIKEKGRLRPGKILLVDTKFGIIIPDDEIKRELVNKYPYTNWLHQNRLIFSDIKLECENISVKNDLDGRFKEYVKVFDYDKEDLNFVIKPMVLEGQEPVGSMGDDTPMPLFSDQPKRLFNYFRQLFAQVTNPPIDSIREGLVMSLTTFAGAKYRNILKETPDLCKTIKFFSPILTNEDLEKLKSLGERGFNSIVIPIVFNVKTKNPVEEFEKRIDEICKEAGKAVDEGINFIILSDRYIDENHAPIPSLLATSAVHHYLIKNKKRLQTALVLETADAREVHHFATLLGYGANLINPYGAIALIDWMCKEKEVEIDFKTALKNYIKAIDKGILKVMSKMGISTLRSYHGAQIFEALGLNEEFVNRYFPYTDSRIGGIGSNELVREIIQVHEKAYIQEPESQRIFISKGFYQYRAKGEKHAWNPETIALLQWAVRNNDYNKYKEFSKKVDEYNRKPNFIRGCFDIKKGTSIPLNEVEPVENIFKRFVTGAMSYGSISKEAHEAIALAMNTINGRSNTGEGGEDSKRFKPLPDGTSLNSAIKQVASARFGVTINYLANAKEIQIKIAQGAKPGEGGQLPGHKVDSVIAYLRHSTPGITLISPPPHHDIYSIEDLKQLIFDLKCANPDAYISVKLVSERGVGTIAAGVAKAYADAIVISGMEGGTGASPLSSIKYAGLPMEMGIAEAHQTLVLNNLRNRVRLQTDGQLKTGKDVVIAALLGAEEYGFATAALITLGCVMMRKCHLNTCPVGVATQDPELRKRFIGKYIYLVNYFTFIANEIREILAEMGFRTMDEIIGRADLLIPRSDIDHWKAKNIDLSRLIFYPNEFEKSVKHFSMPQKHKIDDVLDKKIIEKAEKAIVDKEKIWMSFNITNVDRAVGTMLSGKIAKIYGDEGLPDKTINCKFKGSAGQSFGAFLAKGVQFELEGDANDYLGKGLSGGRIIVYPPKDSKFKPEENIIVGNTVLYGATSGEVYIRGIAGERFAVRNSGAYAVVEGVGDHGCEYMTGGRVVVLNRVGRNFAAGMSGGIAYVLDVDGNFEYFCNKGMVEINGVEDMESIKELQQMIYNHYIYTRSELAEKILENWNFYLPMFVKVIPYEYKKYLEEQKLENIKKKIQVIEDEPFLHY